MIPNEAVRGTKREREGEREGEGEGERDKKDLNMF